MQFGMGLGAGLSFIVSCVVLAIGYGIFKYFFLKTPTGRISKTDLRCRGCRALMQERWPESLLATRHMVCPVCQRTDFYIDDDRVRAFQAQHAEARARIEAR